MAFAFKARPRNSWIANSQRGVVSLRIFFSEETDRDFIRWVSNLLRTFLLEGRITIVGQNAQPDLMIASIWRRHRFPRGLPVVLVSNENWKVFKPHAPLHRYHAVVGLYPPAEPCTFIEYPLAAVHFGVPVEELYTLREELLAVSKTGFCCFVVSKRHRSKKHGNLAAERIALFEQVNAWKRVDSAGAVCNNVGYRAPRGTDFLRWIAKYKYMICLENSHEPGYITEKPFQAWFAGTVPIYHGACIERLNGESIIPIRRGDVICELERLESSHAAYETRRRADLTGSRLSLIAFEQQFRKLILDTIPARQHRGSTEQAGWLKSALARLFPGPE